MWFFQSNKLQNSMKFGMFQYLIKLKASTSIHIDKLSKYEISFAFFKEISLLTVFFIYSIAKRDTIEAEFLPKMDYKS